MNRVLIAFLFMLVSSVSMACLPENTDGVWRFYFTEISSIDSASAKCSVSLIRNQSKDFELGGKTFLVFDVEPGITNCDYGVLYWVESGEFQQTAETCVFMGTFRTSVHVYTIPNGVVSLSGETINGRIQNLTTGIRATFSGSKGVTWWR